MLCWACAWILLQGRTDMVGALRHTPVDDRTVTFSLRIFSLIAFVLLSGVPGAIYGAGKGILGLLLRPVGGILEGGAKLSEGIGLLCLGEAGVSGTLASRVSKKRFSHANNHWKHGFAAGFGVVSFCFVDAPRASLSAAPSIRLPSLGLHRSVRPEPFSQPSRR